MKTVLRTQTRVLLSLSAEELTGIANAINEVCNGVAIQDSEFQTRLGVSRSFLQALIQAMPSQEASPTEPDQAVAVWEDCGSVMLKAFTAFGDPVELGERESKDLLEKFAQAVKAAECGN